MKIQEIVKKAISDTISEYSVSQPTKDIVVGFITSMLAYNSSTTFTEVVISTIDREINSSENPAIIYSLLSDILYKINLDLTELSLESSKVISIDTLIENIKNVHTDSLSKSSIISNETYELYKPSEKIGPLDVVIYLLIQNKFKLIELLKIL